MPSKLSSLAFAATLAAAAFGIPTAAEACSCMDYSPAGTVLDDRDVVFRGTVKELRVPQLLQPDWRHIEPPSRARVVLAPWANATVIAVMEVEEAWKGVYTREIEIDVGSGWCCDCSYGTRFAVPGEELIVFASERENGSLGVSTCSQPVRSEHMGPALEELGPGKKLLLPGRAGDDHESSSPEQRSFAQIAIVVLGLALMLAALVVVRRSRARD